MISIVEALDDPNLFGPWFSGPSWATWKAVLKGAFCLPMDGDDLKLFRAVAERDPPRHRVRELWCVVGRRGGKDSVASAVAAYASGFIDYRKILRPGEQASVLCLAVDKAQASIVEKYTRSYFTEIPLLRGQVRRETGDGLDLKTGASLDVLASNFRGVRGRSVAAVILDEVAFWRSETTANPDTETYQALVPSLATIDGSMLVGISTPYRRAGLLYQKHRDYFGVGDDDVLVVHGSSRTFNPTLPQKVVDDALKRDPAAARAEWLAEWRDDIAAFLSRELIEAAVEHGVVVRPPAPGADYHAFADPSGGLGDSFTAGIAHRDADSRVVLDCLHEVHAPFNPAVATREIAATLKAYGITKVIGDKYAANWVVGEFSRNDLSYEASERDRSAVYCDFLPLLTSGRARLLDSPRLVGQLCNLERKVSPMGRDRIDHPAGAHDDLSNSAAGALVLAGDWGTYDNPARTRRALIMAPVAQRRSFDDDEDEDGPFDSRFPGQRVIADGGRVRARTFLADGMPPSDAEMHRPHQITATFDSAETRTLRADADAAYEERSERDSNAWTWNKPTAAPLPPPRPGESARDQYIRNLTNAWKIPFVVLGPGAAQPPLPARSPDDAGYRDLSGRPAGDRRPQKLGGVSMVHYDAASLADARAAANAAYDEYCGRLVDAWRR